MRILGISGSLRRGSHNRRLLRAARAELPTGVDVVAGADALLIATPEYDASVPGALKNALDWASRPFPENVLNEKPSLVIGASTGLFGAVWAQAEVRKTLAASGAIVLDTELAVAAADGAFRADARSPTRDSGRVYAPCSATSFARWAVARPSA